MAIFHGQIILAVGLLFLMLSNFLFIQSAEINVNTQEQIQNLEAQRQRVQASIEANRQSLQNCQGPTCDAIRQSLEADQKLLDVINQQLQKAQSFQEVESQNAGRFGGGR